MPKVTQAHAGGRFRALQSTYLRWAVGPATAIVLGVFWLGDWIIPLVLSDKYVATVPLVQGMMVGAMVWLALAPLASSLVAFRAPQAMLAINLGGLVLRGVAGCVLIPWLGLAGAAVIFVAVKIAMTTAVVVVALRLSRSQLRAEEATGAVVLRTEGGT
jgi:O-antigen/teichoic acid export membrane protein